MMKIKLHPLMSEFWLEKADSIIAFHEFRLELRSGAHWKSLHWKSYVGLHFNVKISKKRLVWFYKPGELTYRGNKLWERKNKNLRWPRPVRDKSNRRLWNSSWLLLTRLFKPRLRPLLLLLPVVPNQNTSNSFGPSPNADFLFFYNIQ